MDDSGGGGSNASLNTEKVQKMSPSRRIFIITNSNNSFDKGDYISLVQNSKSVARALVAKNKNEIAGIKILKIYNLALWNSLRVGSDVQIIRGDDSFFRQGLKKKADAADAPSKIQSEEDLYNDTRLSDDDLSIEENKNRSIKNDNIITGGYSQVEGVNNDGSAQKYSQFMAQWAYQIEDNIWIEGVFGQSVIRDFPGLGFDTKLTNFTLRGKYTIAGPFYSYIQPYLGYQVLSASSPQAGQQDGGTDPAQLQKEQDLLDSTKKNRLVFGVTWLKRLVPGWFFKADLGTDLIAGGLSLEF